jgi:aryl-alcohol dehydrogenase-like predicted oxidoreductase
MTLRPEPYQHLVSDTIFRGVSALAGEATARGVDITALAIAWVLRHPCVNAAIIGPRTTAQLDAALAAPTVGLSDADVARFADLFQVSR